MSNNICSDVKRHKRTIHNYMSFMIPFFNYVPCLIQLWISLMWIWLWYFIQHIHLCLYIFTWLEVIFLSLLKHIDIGVILDLLIFHWFIIIWRCKLVHKLGLYTSCNVPSLVSYQFWTWDFWWLLRCYRKSLLRFDPYDFEP
jgi:hypothetical protein